MNKIQNYNADRSELLPEKEKMTYEYLQANVEYNIYSLVYEKKDLKKAYNYYNGKMDAEQFKGLEENYGIGNPHCVEFIPLIRQHVDALVGEFLTTRLNPKVTCKDQTTLDAIQHQRNFEIARALTMQIKKQYEENLKVLKNLGIEKDLLAENVLKDIMSETEKNFHSPYEKSAQTVIKYLLNSKDTDIKNKLKNLFIDLLVAGQCYYRAGLNNIGEDPFLEVLNPLDVFFHKNTNDSYIKDTDRVVVREYLTRTQILNKYGHLMTDEDKERVMGKDILTGQGEAVFYKTDSIDNSNYLLSNTGTALDQSRLQYYLNEQIVVCYYVEWLANNEVVVEDESYETQEDLWQVDVPKEGMYKKKIKRYRLDRYQGIRIGHDIYVGLGKAKNVIRPIDKPYECSLTVNGVAYSDRNGTPYSMILATANLQDKYNILHFHRDNIIANSGVKGDFVDVTMIPNFLGTDLTDRLVKWKAYKKQGMALINPAQEGVTSLNTIFSGYDDSLNGQAIEAINYTIKSIEETASKITGVLPQMLGNIEQRDAVSNVQVGIKQSSLLTKQFFYLLSQMAKHAIGDLVDYAKISYRKGKKGSYILGNKREFFTIEPNMFSFTDYDIHITDGEFEYKDAEALKQVAIELARSGQVDIDTVLTILTSDSLTEIKEEVRKDIKDSHGQQIMQLQQQLEQLTAEHQKALAAAKEMEGKVQKFNDAKMQLEKQKLELEFATKKEELRVKENFNNAKIDEIRERTMLEEIQAKYTPTNKDNEVVNL